MALEACRDDGNAMEGILEAQKRCLRVRNWVKYGRPDATTLVGHPWPVVAEALMRENLDREDLGTAWELDLSRGCRFEDWIIRRI